ncbi:hypothetical protein BCR35DRAFT_305848 [Leucosporidium creatinivorum]|uniref:F-box domain-containing protein n=1 Tax=Leucosporidium creatinivorum TaxID=106004 RepID=A0A1Y2EXC1_9BASI|nr:hypothetical protein BCR35DRAFT_305848 [Leucosporidium creatinivorum]
MAVIQDLPPELLIRILELTVGSRITVSQQAVTRSTFVQASLVARRWRAPSQQLLASTFTVTSSDWVWTRYLDAIQKLAPHFRRPEWKATCSSFLKATRRVAVGRAARPSPAAKCQFS